VFPSLSTRKALSSNSRTRWPRSVCFSALRRRLNAARCCGKRAIRRRPVRRYPQTGHTDPDSSPDATTKAPRVARSDCQSETASRIVFRPSVDARTELPASLAAEAKKKNPAIT